MKTSPYSWMVEQRPATNLAALSPLLTVAQAAELCGTCPTTIRRWIQRGLLHATRPGGPRGNHRIAADALRRL